MSEASTSIGTRIDRRALFSRGSAAALLASVGISAQAAPSRGGHLRVALSGGDRGDSLLHQSGGLFLQAVRATVFENLTEIAPDGTLQPALAKGWTSQENGRTWHFELESGVPFHNGTVMTPNDVVASLRLQGLDAQSGPKSVTVTLDQPNMGLPFELAKDGFQILRADELATGVTVSGTGMYFLSRFDPGRGFLGERVDTHRKDGRAGWFDTVEFVSVSDESVRRDALRDGIVDVADLADGSALNGLSDLRVIAETGQTAGLRTKVRTNIRTGAAPLDDMRFAERWWLTT